MPIDEPTLTDEDIETVVRGSAASLETDPDSTDGGDTDDTDSDDDATDEGGGDTDSTDS